MVAHIDAAELLPPKMTTADSSPSRPFAVVR
jgi:hypothetical protein